MTSAEINRVYAAVAYVIFAIIAVLGIIETVIIYERHFHAPIFVLLIFANFIGLLSVLNYQLDIERRVVVVQYVMNIAFLAATFYLFLSSRVPTSMVVSYQLVIILKLLWISHRRRCIKSLNEEAVKLAMLSRDAKAREVTRDDN
jgi:hypothetical protein